MMAGNPHITAIDLRGNGFDADGLYALVQVTAARDCARHSAPRGVAQPEWRCGTRWRGRGGCRTLPTRDGCRLMARPPPSHRQALKTMPKVAKLNLRNNCCRNQGVEALGASAARDGPCARAWGGEAIG